ncbi:hypothetical protein F4802DRAFT_594206 [Xylaria palmicola]|nr:hypothetical protein F4802DRAFT_594206 [Xylaria palmicola]
MLPQSVIAVVLALHGRCELETAGGGGRGRTEQALATPSPRRGAARLSCADAQALLRAAVPLALLLSRLLGSFVPSVTLMVLLRLYNNLDCGGNDLLVRNGINAAGLSWFGWGATAALFAGDISEEAERVLGRFMGLMAIMIATTI